MIEPIPSPQALISRLLDAVEQQGSTFNEAASRAALATIIDVADHHMAAVRTTLQALSEAEARHASLVTAIGKLERWYCAPRDGGNEMRRTDDGDWIYAPDVEALVKK